jgi:hypothetical protein
METNDARNENYGLLNINDSRIVITHSAQAWKFRTTLIPNSSRELLAKCLIGPQYCIESHEGVVRYVNSLRLLKVNRYILRVCVCVCNSSWDMHTSPAAVLK